MSHNHAKRLERLSDVNTQIEPNDAMAEAGRKILLTNFVQMLQHEGGSRTGEDIEDVHDMRVATRRMRSAFRLLKAYYKPKTIRPYMKELRTLASALGSVRDLDVMIDDLTKYHAGLDVDAQARLQDVINQLDKRRKKARQRLNKTLDSRSYNRFVKTYSNFLTSPGNGTINPDVKAVRPYQARHVIPVILHQHLATVRAYDPVLDNASQETLHALRIEFKRLRYAVSFFTDVLGSTAENFVEEIKTMQDYLGRLNDILVAREWLDTLNDLDDEQTDVVETYMTQLEAEAQTKIEQFPEAWARFNSRSVQRKLSDAMLVLR